MRMRITLAALVLGLGLVTAGCAAGAGGSAGGDETWGTASDDVIAIAPDVPATPVVVPSATGAYPAPPPPSGTVVVDCPTRRRCCPPVIRVPC